MIGVYEVFEDFADAEAAQDAIIQDYFVWILRSWLDSGLHGDFFSQIAVY